MGWVIEGGPKAQKPKFIKKFTSFTVNGIGWKSNKIAWHEAFYKKNFSVKLVALVVVVVLLLAGPAESGPGLYGTCIAACQTVAFLGSLGAGAATGGVLAAAAAAGAAAGLNGISACASACLPFLTTPTPWSLQLSSSWNKQDNKMKLTLPLTWII